VRGGVCIVQIYFSGSVFLDLNLRRCRTEAYAFCWLLVAWGDSVGGGSGCSCSGVWLGGEFFDGLVVVVAWGGSIGGGSGWYLKELR
ncbi:hypothetical protein A2U01_0056921, partial [Trifolium medium]|nr:hypothetical protein [Trifolium medium]